MWKSFRANNLFSTTAKVILSLLIISAMIGVAFPILGGLGSAVEPLNSNSPGTPGEEETDTIRNATPAQAWNNLLVKAIANQCVTDGMSEAEVLLAIGEPNERYVDQEISSWTWHPRKLNETTIFFTPKATFIFGTADVKALEG